MALRVLSLNTWTGFDAHGRFRLGRYENDADWRRRRQALIDFVRHVDPDIVALQEVCLLPGSARELAEAVGGEFAYQVANAGVRLFGHGFPVGFSEGLVTIVRHGLSIKRSSSLKLSGPWTWFWRDAVSLQTAETRWLLEVEIAGYYHPFHIFNLHTHFSPLSVPLGGQDPERAAAGSRESESESGPILDGLRRRESEIQNAFEYVYWLLQGRAALVLGDLNMEPTDEWLQALIRKEGMIDVLSSNTSPTWNPERNPLAALGTTPHFLSGKRKAGIDAIASLYDRVPKRVDYILVKALPESTRLTEAHVADAVSPGGVWFSDHAAVVAEFDDTDTAMNAEAFREEVSEPWF